MYLPYLFNIQKKYEKSKTFSSIHEALRCNILRRTALRGLVSLRIISWHCMLR